MEWVEWDQLLSNKGFLIIEQIINNVQEENNMCTSKCYRSNRGIPQTTKRTIVWRRRRRGSLEIVSRFLCPCCGDTGSEVEVYGLPISAARLAVLQAMV